ncbi:MAG: polyprenyl diphosphate synthase [archaeon]
MEEIEIELSGRVQGVNFRSAIKDFADKNEIKGYVLNKDDGSVYIIGQGERMQLEKFLYWIESDPGFVKVEEMTHVWKKIRTEHKQFDIVRKGSYVVDKAKGVINLAKGLVKNDLTVPVHVAIIPDGNRRWAKEKGLIATQGHYKAGSKENILSLFGEAQRLGVKYLSIWGFSTENWKRDKKEVDAIFSLVLGVVKELETEAKEKKIRFRHIGRKDRLPRDLLNALNDLEEKTKDFSDFNVQLCLDYGGRDEIVRAVNQMLKNGVDKVDEESIKDYLDSKGIPDPDLIIRTSGEKRTSGLMPYQSVYSELYFTDLHFPDFTPKELRKAVEYYSQRQRSFGN